MTVAMPTARHGLQRARPETSSRTSHAAIRPRVRSSVSAPPPKPWSNSKRVSRKKHAWLPVCASACAAPSAHGIQLATRNWFVSEISETTNPPSEKTRPPKTASGAESAARSWRYRAMPQPAMKRWNAKKIEKPCAKGSR